MAIKTAKRDNTMVKIGKRHAISSSSLSPPKAPKAMIAIIWKAILEYFAYALSLFFSSSLLMCTLHLALTGKTGSSFDTKSSGNYFPF